MKKLSINLGGSGATLLTITFVILKAMGLIDWSWWWVFAPLWIGVAIALVIIVIVLIVAVIVAALGD